MSKDQLKQDVINGAVWKACETFRGTVDPSIYKDYILTMLFLKYISDVWQDHYDEYQRQYGAHPDLIREMLKNERFVLPPNANFYALHEARHKCGNGERIDKALHAIEDANLSKLRDVFQDISFNAGKLGEEAQKNEILRHLMEDFASPDLNLHPSRVGAIDVIGNAYEFLIKNFASTSGKKAGEFYTPPEVSLLLASLTAPAEGDHICDPTCGSGSLLMKCGQLVRKLRGAKKYALYGQEAIGSTWALAKMNMFLHGEDNHRIEWGDTLRNPRLLDPEGSLVQFDVVVANPPFSLDKWGYESAVNDKYKRFRRGVPPRTKGDFAFILHMIEVMKPGNGRMAVVVPHGVLFRGGAEGKIRQQLVEENLLDTVIGMPEKLFYGTGIPSSILIFRRDKKDGSVLFIDASREFMDGKNQNQLRDCDLEKIMTTCRDRVDVPLYAYLATHQEIVDKEYNLNIPRYVDTYAKDVTVSLQTLRAEARELTEEIALMEDKLDEYWRDIGYREKL